MGFNSGFKGLKWIVKKWGGVMPWIGLAMVGDIVNAVMNVWVL